MAHTLALVGFGTVSQGLARLLVDKADVLEQQHGATFRVTTIATHSRGTLHDPAGLDLSAALRAAQTGSLEAYPGDDLKRWDGVQAIQNSGAQVVVENTPTNLDDAEPAMTHFKTALEGGQHVITANKGPIALAYKALEQLAQKHHVHLLFEGTVLSGTPILSLARCGLGGCHISQIKGILNGTTNYILSQMEEGMGYDEALRRAQALGFAEADPSADVDGWDALAKVVILANVLMGANLSVGDVKREGIAGITATDVARAKAEGRRWKLIGSARREGETIKASVQPTLIPLDDPLAGVGAAMNALTFYTDVLQSVTIRGVGAGGPQTGFAVLSDLLELHRRLS